MSIWPLTQRIADRHFSHDRTPAAIEEYRKLVDLDPTDLTALNTLGDLCARAGLSEEAKHIFSRVAQGYSHQGFTAKAIALLKKLLRIDPDDLDSTVKLAECYQARGLRREAARLYGDVADAFTRAGREDNALEAYQRLAEIDPSNTSLLMTLGERWLREGLKQRAHASFVAAADEFLIQHDDERALAAYLSASAARPDEPKTLAAIASIYAARGQVDRAIPLLCDSIGRNPADPEPLRMLGSTYLSAGRFDDAQRTFQTLLDLDGGEYRNLLLVGERLLEIGDLDHAAQQIDAVVDALIARRDEQEAIDFLQRILDRDPQHLGTLKRLALMFRRLREDFNLVRTLKALANAAQERGLRDEVVEALKELCTLEPQEPAHRDSLQRLGVDVPAIHYVTDASKPFAPAYEFVPADEILGVMRFSQPDFPSGANWRGTNTVIKAGTAGNRRQAERISLRVPVVVISDADGWREFTETVDVSEAGLGLQLTHPVSPMSVLSVSLDMTRWPQTVAKMQAANAKQGLVRYCSRSPFGMSLVGIDLKCST